MFVWFEAAEPYRRYVNSLRDLQRAAERHLSGLESTLGYCVPCGEIQPFKVANGPRYGEAINLREGLVCSRGLSNRNRLLAAACMASTAEPTTARAALLERLTPLYAALKARFPLLLGSEYLGPSASPGETRMVHGQEVRHESLERLSYLSESFDLLVHADVLEHVPSLEGALSECFRVLRATGTCIFTCPFFASRSDVYRRAIRHADGSIEHLVDPEYHGDPLNPAGVLAYFHFGWELLEKIRGAGFTTAAVGLWYDVFCGFVSDNHPDLEYGNMMPVVIRASR